MSIVNSQKIILYVRVQYIFQNHIVRSNAAYLQNHVIRLSTVHPENHTIRPSIVFSQKLHYTSQYNESSKSYNMSEHSIPKKSVLYVRVHYIPNNHTIRPSILNL